jgi:hypothetical protein
VEVTRLAEDLPDVEVDTATGVGVFVCLAFDRVPAAACTTQIPAVRFEYGVQAVLELAVHLPVTHAHI